jgi:D-sedoheptulose 7-phosphate isomerase
MPTLREHFLQSSSVADFSTRYLDYLWQLLRSVEPSVFASVLSEFQETAARSGTIFVCGNGGSGALASHMANDFGIGVRMGGPARFRIISLGDNQATITALANDFGYETIFVKQLESLSMTRTDLLVCMSVSGNSPNIVSAARYAKQLGARIVGCTGFDGGQLKELSDVSFHVPAVKGEYGPVEDAFSILDHLLYSYLCLERTRSP